MEGVIIRFDMKKYQLMSFSFITLNTSLFVSMLLCDIRVVDSNEFVIKEI